VETFAKFRTALLTGALAAVLSLVGYTWNNHVNAEGAEFRKLANEIEEREKVDARHDEDIKVLRELTIRMESYIEHQKQLNEWFTTEHLERNRGSN
jgi:hypothetical protein